MDKLETLKGVYRQLNEAGHVTSQRDFARLLDVNEKGLSSAMNGSERHLTSSLVAKATRLYSELMTSEKDTPATVPLFPFSVRAGVSLNDITEGMTDDQCERITSPVRGAELAVEVVGDSMAPAFPAGARVLLRRVPADTFITWGEVFVVDTVNGPMLKRIMPTEDEHVWEMRSDNPAYPPFQVKTEHVRSVWRVLLRMIQ